MASALVAQGSSVDFIGSDKLNAPDLHRAPIITFLNLRGNQAEDAPFGRKFVRILTYYTRLAKYIVRSEPRIFHVLWNNKFEHFDPNSVNALLPSFRETDHPYGTQRQYPPAGQW
jgi:hypothetical protein